MRFKVKLVQVTYDYVDILVDEKDVDTAQHATDFVNDQMANPNWYPHDHCIEGSDYAEVNHPFEILDVEPIRRSGWEMVQDRLKEREEDAKGDKSP